jgi:acyl dehydratase
MIITEAALEDMRGQLHVPWRVRGWNSSVTPDAIWRFALGIGDNNPLWWDREYAESSSVGALCAPPTFLYSCQGASAVPLAEGTITRGFDSWLPGAPGLWASERWEFFGRVFAGQSIIATAELWEFHESMSDFAGSGIYHTMRTRFASAEGKLLAYQFRTIFRMEPGSARSPGLDASTDSRSYSAEDLDRFRKQYVAEEKRRRGATTRYVEDVTIGESLPPILKGPLSITSLVGWAAGSGATYCLPDRIGSLFLDKVPSAAVVNPRFGYRDTLEGPHWDSDLAQTRGMPRGFAFGAQRISWFAHLLSDWYGDDGQLAELNVRLRRPNLLGDVQWLSGSVTDSCVKEGIGQVTFSLDSRNQRGELTATATATALLRCRQSLAVGEH